MNYQCRLRSLIFSPASKPRSRRLESNHLTPLAGSDVSLRGWFSYFNALLVEDCSAGSFFALKGARNHGDASCSTSDEPILRQIRK